MYPIYPAPVRDAVTGELNSALVGEQVQVVTRGTTTPYPIYNGAGDPIASSLVTVSSAFTTPTVYIDTETPEDVYLDWYHAGSGAQGAVDFEEVMRELASGSVKSVNGVTPDEAGDVVVEATGTDDAGIGELVTNTGSATYAALTERFGVGFIGLDTGEAAPPGTPDGTYILRAAGGGVGPTPVVVYAEDTFARTVALGWGTASGGGEWVSFPADDPVWSVGSGAGKYIAPGAGSHASDMRLSSYSQSTVEVEGIVSQEVGDAGSRFVKIYPRRIIGNDVHYNATLSLRGPNASRPLQVDLSLGKGFNIGDLQATLAGVATTGALGEMVRFRIQVIQEDAATTRVRARVWLDGTTEPATWQREATDTDVALQGAGHLAINVQQQTSETVASEVRLHEITVRSIA